MGMHIHIPEDRIAAYCREWKIRECAIFGSALTNEFRSDSDVDVLVVLEEDANWSLFDHIQAEDDLGEILGRHVDLVEKNAIRNPFRRHHILNNCEVVYAA